jgi:hypothetical protein
MKLINFLTIIKEIKASYDGVFDECVSNTRAYQVDKITIIGGGNPDFSCNTQLCTPQTFDYNITCNGKTILTTVYFSTQRAIIEKGLNQKGKLLYLYEPYIRGRISKNFDSRPVPKLNKIDSFFKIV